MENLTFGEQVKIVLSRKGMTIKELAEIIEERTGKKMSRQNLTQRLGRDNFQEQDMRMIASILECPLTRDILSGVERHSEKPIRTSKPSQRTYTAPAQSVAPVSAEASNEKVPVKTEATAEVTPAVSNVPEKSIQDEAPATTSAATKDERDITIGELYNAHNELNKMEEEVHTGKIPVEEIQAALAQNDPLQEEISSQNAQMEQQAEQAAADEPTYHHPHSAPIEPDDDDFEPIVSREDFDEDLELGDVNPYTGHEYQTNSVRMHPSRIGYVQVYDRTNHKWTDMTEWAFLGYQERKKALLGKEYDPPIYLD